MTVAGALLLRRQFLGAGAMIMEDCFRPGRYHYVGQHLSTDAEARAARRLYELVLRCQTETGAHFRHLRSLALYAFASSGPSMNEENKCKALYLLAFGFADTERKWWWSRAWLEDRVFHLLLNGLQPTQRRLSVKASRWLAEDGPHWFDVLADRLYERGQLPGSIEKRPLPAKAKPRPSLNDGPEVPAARGLAVDEGSQRVERVSPGLDSTEDAGR